MEMKLEVVVLPVADVDRAKKFYGGLGWRLDADFTSAKDLRILQMTPPGSHCSVIFGKGVTTAAPGSIKGLYLVVSDIEAARRELAGHGVGVGEPFHITSDLTPAPGRDPNGRSYFTYASFSDPDGNVWLLQEVTKRLPGRADEETEFHSERELAGALRRAETAHGKHEAKIGKRDEAWSDWYAKYLAREQAGAELPT